jgi:ComF family protein
MRQGLCTQCGSSLVIEQGSKCFLCGKPLISEIDICMPCRGSQSPSYDRLWTLFPYTGKYRALLKAYKFGKRTSLADFFAAKILEVIGQTPELKDAVIVPVPPRPGKIKDSGWDQVIYLVKRFTNVNQCLVRNKSGVQKRLNRAQRMENLKGRIVLNGKAPEKALIIDDVITTGSTMEVCSFALKEGGSKEIYGLTLFYD